MINRVELITLHISDLLEMLDADLGGEGSLVLTVDGVEQAEVDLANLCLCLKLDTSPISEGQVIPITSGHKE
jgi:hypothetical protein